MLRCHILFQATSNRLLMLRCNILFQVTSKQLLMLLCNIRWYPKGSRIALAMKLLWMAGVEEKRSQSAITLWTNLLVARAFTEDWCVVLCWLNIRNHQHDCRLFAGWWFQILILSTLFGWLVVWNMKIIFPYIYICIYIWNFIIPTDEVIFVRGVG